MKIDIPNLVAREHEARPFEPSPTDVRENVGRLAVLFTQHGLEVQKMRGEIDMGHFSYSGQHAVWLEVLKGGSDNRSRLVVDVNSPVLLPDSTLFRAFICDETQTTSHEFSNMVRTYQPNPEVFPLGVSREVLKKEYQVFYRGEPTKDSVSN